MFRIPPVLLLTTSLLLGLVACGCERAAEQLERKVVDAARRAASRQMRSATDSNPPDSRPASPRRSGVPVAKAADTIRVASFNIQVFGLSKLDKPEVMEVLADVVRRYDVVAIQELRSKDQSVVPRFLNLINSDGSQYDSVVGPRLGRTSSKEQYVFVYDATRIALDARSVYTVDDPEDLLHREPLVARFQVRGLPPEQAFSFTLVNIHTDPDETDIELDALDDAFVAVQQNGSGEDDVILLGDLNVDQDHLGQLGALPNITWTVRGEPTNTRRNKSYDNLVFDSRATQEYTGQAGVFNLMSEYGMSEDEALDVSDHLPVWAEFHIHENGGARLAAQP